MSEAILSRKEFESLKERDKWEYVDGLYKMIKVLKIKADKNCEMCQAEMLVADDINIDLMFEDWRECSDHCSKCGLEDRVFMCNLQFEVMNLIANSLAELRSRQNALANIVLKQDERGSKLLRDHEEAIKRAKERSQQIFS